MNTTTTTTTHHLATEHTNNHPGLAITAQHTDTFFTTKLACHAVLKHCSASNSTLRYHTPLATGHRAITEQS